MKLVMNADGKLGHGDGSPVTGGVFVVTSESSASVKIDSKGVHAGSVKFMFSGGSSTGFNPGSVTGAGTIYATAQKTRVDGSPVVRIGDSVIIVATGIIAGSVPPESDTIEGMNVEVSDAGQSSMRAD